MWPVHRLAMWMWPVSRRYLSPSNNEAVLTDNFPYADKHGEVKKTAVKKTLKDLLIKKIIPSKQYCLSGCFLNVKLLRIFV